MNKNQQKLVHYCYDLLSRRRYSIREMVKKLESYNHKYEELCNDDELKEILEALIKANLINDRDFATFHIQGQLGRKPVGPAKLRQQLRKKGIEESIIMQSINKAHLDEKSLAQQLLLKKAKLYNTKQLSDIKVQARLVRFLASNGFNNEVSYKAIKELCRSNQSDLLIND